MTRPWPQSSHSYEKAELCLSIDDPAGALNVRILSDGLGEQITSISDRLLRIHKDLFEFLGIEATLLEVLKAIAPYTG